MDLPIFNNFAPRDRVATRRFAIDSDTAETDASFARLLARRENGTRRATTRKDETNRSAANPLPPVASAPPPSEPPSRAGDASGQVNTEHNASASPRQPAESTDAEDARQADTEERDQEDVAKITDDSTSSNAPASQDAPAVAGPHVAEPTALNAKQADATQTDAGPSRTGPQDTSVPERAAMRTEQGEVATQKTTAAEPIQLPIEPQLNPNTEDAEPKGRSADKATRSKGTHRRARSRLAKGDNAPPDPTTNKGVASPPGSTSTAFDNTQGPAFEGAPVVDKVAAQQAAERIKTDLRADQNAQLAAADKGASETASENGSARGSLRAQTGTQLSKLEQIRLVQRVARAVQTAPQRGGTIRLRLRPPALGSMHLEVRMERDGLAARIETETQMARSVLLDSLPQLRERLAEQGIRIEHFNVDVSQQDTRQSQQQANQTETPFESPDARMNQHNQEESEERSEVSAEVTHVISQRNLNVVI